MNTMPEYNIIEEAQNRHEFERREAYGEIDGENVVLAIDLNKHGSPYAWASFGGQWYHYEEEEIDDEFAGGTSHETRFDKAQSAIWYFEELVEQYGLSEELPESWKEANTPNA